MSKARKNFTKLQVKITTGGGDEIAESDLIDQTNLTLEDVEELLDQWDFKTDSTKLFIIQFKTELKTLTL